ncbi:ABC transporter substrate-binding protein [Methanohalophilus mahii]|uniref:ABC-type nitrate/sulfonate/bicarbonate transport system periplasmic components n=1 Tax=Methanohalophilus mahii (strain ATCC 35705 / DSM 5219 / SLP) TaxID=547558 RepID=D5EAM9_METMS|nr:ABC transporter substrate-binding protein [Methanohalophilus mahii]ADE36230.1 ABC-type nitrate/sulfonate/bicarbonate transport system periplasmic components [Methanohalophilus mahii DSM 5219]
MRKSLNIGHLSTMYHTSFILMNTDWLKKANIEANWSLFGGGPAIVQAFERGEVDLGYIGLPPVMIGIDRGVAIKCIAGGHVEGTVMIANSEFKSLDQCGSNPSLFFEQFKGLTIACPPDGSIHDVIIRNCIKKSGFEGKITVKNYEWADMIPEAMADGEIQVAVGTPSLAVAAKRFCNAKTVISPDRLWPDNPSYGIIASADVIENFPELVLDFIKIHDKGCKFIRKNPGNAARIVAEKVGVVDADFVQEMYEISPKYFAGISYKYIESTMKFNPTLHELGFISQPLEEKDIFDMRFVNQLAL